MILALNPIVINGAQTLKIDCVGALIVWDPGKDWNSYAAVNSTAHSSNAQYYKIRNHCNQQFFQNKQHFKQLVQAILSIDIFPHFLFVSSQSNFIIQPITDKLKNMSENNTEPIGQIQLPQCPVCNLQPIPESVQFVPFIMLEVLLAFVSLKLSGIFVLCSYCFAKNAWFCPQCKRQVEVIHDVPGISENLIIRMGNCMFMLSKFKYRVIAAIVTSYLFYIYLTQVQEKPQIKVEKTWESLATTSGYEAFLQNSYKANTMYSQYPQLGQWTITGAFLRQEQITNKVKKILLKMNPSQFKNPETEDVAVIITMHTVFDDKNLEVGDLVEARGQWEGRQAQGHLFKFLALKVHKTGAKLDPKDAKLLPSAERFIKLHNQEGSLTKNLASN